MTNKTRTTYYLCCLAISCLICCFDSNTHAQPVDLFSSDFENASQLYFIHDGVNQWKTATCAGNGSSQAGTRALYASKGGSTPNDCGMDGEHQYAFAPAPPSAIEQMTAYTKIDGRCTKSHVVSFDYKWFPVHSAHVVEVVYSIDGGNFWFVQDTIPYHDGWTNTAIELDAVTNNFFDFFVGIRFIYRDSDATGDPIAIDNLKIMGTKAIANIVLDTLKLCGLTSTVIEADDYYSGSGLWTLESGQGIFTNEQAHAPGINNLGIGTNIFVWTVSSSDCGTSSDTLVVMNYIAPSEAHLTDTIYACSAQQLTIFTSPPLSGVGTWQSLQGGTIVNANSPSATLTNIPGGWSELVWTIATEGCPPKSDTSHVFSLGGQKIMTVDTTICYDVNADFTVHTTPMDEAQSVQWHFVSGGANHLSTQGDHVVLSGLYPGDHELVYTVSHAFCPYTDIESDTISIHVAICDMLDIKFPTVITPNGDGRNDVFVINNLQNKYPNCRLWIFNRWGAVVFESVGYDKPWNGTIDGEKLPIGTYFFKLDLNDGEKTIYTGSISLIY